MEGLDPVLRCDSCQKLVQLVTLHKLGCCPGCGNKRIRNLTVMSERELNQVREWGFEQFANEWGQVDV